MVAAERPWGPSTTQDVMATPDAEVKRARRDALPEHTRYVDSGCHVHSSCLTCPLVRCRYDEPGGLRGILSKERDAGILALRGQGRPISLIAQRYGVSRRTVFRVLAAGRGAREG